MLMKAIIFALVLALCICSELHAAQDLIHRTPNVDLPEAMLLLAAHGYAVDGAGWVELNGQAIDIRTMLEAEA